MKSSRIRCLRSMSLVAIAALLLIGCGSSDDPSNETSSSSSTQSSSVADGNSSGVSSSAAGQSSSSNSEESDTFYRGVDLSYVNEMEDCGAVYRDNGEAKDPYVIFDDHGANLVRLRLWHTPDWQTANPEEDINNYSNLDDVKKAIARAKAQGLKVLLDFHYSDTWADPGRQNIPAAWSELVDDTEALSQAVYDYTYATLAELDDAGLMPEMVQVGNETNGSLMMTPGEDLFPIDWERNSALFNAGIEAVRTVGASSDIQPKIMLHIAEPENIQWWFEAATDNGVTDFDVIGISYYTAWSDYTSEQVGELIEDLVEEFEREVIIVETGVSWTDTGADASGDIGMRPPGVIESTPEAQAEWLIHLTDEAFNHGGSGVVYWEPAWVSTDCYNQWDQGSHWESNTFFDFDGNVIENGGIQFLSHDYQLADHEVEVSFQVQMIEETTSGAYITGDFTTEGNFIEMEDLGDGLYQHTTNLPAHFAGQYYFLTSPDNADKETVPDACTGLDHDNRHYHLGTEDALYQFPFGACDGTPTSNVTFRVDMSAVEGAEQAYVTGDFPGDENWQILPMESESESLFQLTLEMPVGSSGAYYFLEGNDWVDRETVPEECAEVYESDRLFTAPDAAGETSVLAYPYGSCSELAY